MVVIRPPTWWQMSSMVRFWAERIQCLILAKVCSIGLRSGEYGGRYQLKASTTEGGFGDAAAFLPAEATSRLLKKSVAKRFVS